MIHVCIILLTITIIFYHDTILPGIISVNYIKGYTSFAWILLINFHLGTGQNLSLKGDLIKSSLKNRVRNLYSCGSRFFVNGGHKKK